MKHSVEIHYTDGNTAVILHADKVELLGVGGGILSVIKGRKNFCYTLQMIRSYQVMDEEGEQE